MELNIDNDDLVEAIREDSDLLYAIADAFATRMRETIRDEVLEALDYHDDRFRLSWVRMMESELNDLEHSTLNDACGHGQKIYAGLFHAMREYMEHHVIEMRATLGIDTIAQTVHEVATAAVDGRIDQAWNGDMGGITLRPRINEVEPALRVATDEFGNPIGNRTIVS